MAACFGVDFAADGEIHVARVHADEAPTDPETIEAIRAVCKAAYDMLKESDMERPPLYASVAQWRNYALWLEQKYGHVATEAKPPPVDTLGPTGRKSRRW